MKKRIAIAVSNLPVVYWQWFKTFCLEFTQRDYEVDVFAFNQVKQPDYGESINVFPFLSAFIPDCPQAKSYLEENIANKQYEIAIGFELYGLKYAEQIANKAATRLGYYSCELYDESNPSLYESNIGTLLKYLREMMGKIDLFMIQDSDRFEECMRLLGPGTTPPKEVLYFPVCLPSLQSKYQYRSELRKALGIPEASKIVLYIGGLRENRYLYELTTYSQRLSEDTYVLIHGHSHYDPALLLRIQEMNINGRVHLSAKDLDDEELEKMLSGADIGFLYYRADVRNDFLTGRSSSKLALYLQHHLPVIVPDYPSFQRDINEYGYGKCIHDFFELPSAVKDITDNIEQYRLGAESAFEHIFDQRKYVDAIVTKLGEWRQNKPGENNHITLINETVSNSSISNSITLENKEFKKVKYSVCVPTYNRAAFIKEAVESVVKTCSSDLEIVIVDDGSTDTTSEIIASLADPRVRYIRKEHTSAPDTRNRCIAEARGEYIIWLDSDDAFTPGLIDKYHSILQSDPSIDIIYGNIQVCDHNLQPNGHLLTYRDFGNPTESFLQSLFAGSPIPNMGTMVKKRIYQTHGGFDIRFKRAHDYEFWSRGWVGCKFHYVNETVGFWRWHDENMSSGSVKIDFSYDVAILKSILSRYSLNELFPYQRKASEKPAIHYALSLVTIGNRFIQLDSQTDAIDYFSRAFQFTSDSRLRSEIMDRLAARILNPKEYRGISKPSKSILYVVHNIPPFASGGSENHTQILASHLKNIGFECDIMFPLHDPEEDDHKFTMFFWNGLRIFQVSYNRFLESSDTLIGKVFSSFIKAKGYSIIHFQHIIGFPVTLIREALDAGCKVAVTLHDYWYFCRRVHLFIPDTKSVCTGPETPRKCALCLQPMLPHAEPDSLAKSISVQLEITRGIFRRVHLLSAPSHFVKDIYSKFGLVNTRFEVNDLGLPDSQAMPKIKSQYLRIGYIGSIHAIKNLETIVYAAQHTEDGCQYAIWGNGLFDSLNQLLDSIEDLKNISYNGPYIRENLPAIFSEIDVLVVPSFLESSSITIREAFQNNTIVIAAARGGMVELVQDGVNGFLFNPDKPEELAAIINRLARDKSLLRQLEQNIKQVFSCKDEAQLWKHKYLNLLTDNQNSDAMRSVKVSIIIPLYNRLELTKQCFESIVAFTQKGLYEIIFVDNYSSDGTREYLNAIISQYPDVKTIFNSNNAGFAKANNQGFRESRGEYILLLNNDTKVTQGWLEPLIALLDDDSTITAVGPKLLYPDGSIQHVGVFVYHHTSENKIGAYHVDYKKPGDTPAASVAMEYRVLTAACILIRREMYERVGGLDEGFWNGYEDVDFCFKVSAAGGRLIYQPKSVVWHYESQSGTERFSRASMNEELLNSRWLGKIQPDFLYGPDGTMEKLPESIIRPYFRPVLSVVIPVFNQWEYTEACLTSLHQTLSIPSEIIIVDDCSSDGTFEKLKKFSSHFSLLRVVQNSSNSGFPKSVNTGLRIATGEYVLIANNDIIFTAGWFEALRSAIDNTPQGGMSGPLSNAVSGVQLVKGISYDSLEKMHEIAAQFSETNKGQTAIFPRVAFLCTLIKRSVLDAIGGLDERFSPGNFEDDDYCLRVQLAGFKTVIAIDTFIHHFGSKSFTAEGNERYAKLLEKNKRKFISKWGADPDEIWLKGVAPKSRTLRIPLQSQRSSELSAQLQECLNDNDYESAHRVILELLELAKSPGSGIQGDQVEKLKLLAGKLEAILQ